MTDKQKWFIYGMVSIAVPVLLLSWLLLIPNLKKLNSETDAYMRENEHLQDSAQYTLLYDFSAVKPLGVGPFAVLPRGQDGVLGQSVQRWIVPVRVKPLVVGTTRGAQYVYYDPRTKRVEGPYVPDGPLYPALVQP